MVGRGYARAFAEACFRQIEGFGTYGFPESHAASFALLVYISAWLKCHYPASFACALLNSQPMGFYAPAQILRDARAHGVAVREIDINASEWECTMEGPALRLGFRLIDGFHEDWAATLVAARGPRFADFTALLASGIQKPALLLLADADALRGIGLDRRLALWRVRSLQDDRDLPLLATLPIRPSRTILPPMQQAEQVVADYQSIGMSLKAHPMRFLRPGFTQQGARSCVEANQLSDGARLRIAGVVTVRQRPGSAQGVVFITIEDETGIANIVVWPSLLAHFRREILGASLLLVDGQVQRSKEDIIHIVAERLEDHSLALQKLSDTPPPHVLARGDEGPSLPTSRNMPNQSQRHPRNHRIIPRSRDFH